MLTTRVAAKDKKDTLGHSLRLELLRNPKGLAIGSTLASVIGLVPGMPALPFLTVGAVFGALAYRAERAKNLVPATQDRAQALKRSLEERVKAAQAQRSAADSVAPTVAPITIDLDPVLSAAIGFDDARSADQTELLSVLVPDLRDALYIDTGVRFPGVRVRSNTPGLAPGQLQIRIKDVPIAREKVEVDRVLAVEQAERLKRLGIESAPTKHPLFGSPAALVEPEHQELLEAAGIPVWTAAGVVALHLARVLRRRARDFVGLQEASDLVDRLEKAYPALVKEVIPKVVALPQLVDVLRRLVDESVSIRDLKTIVEALGECAPYENDGVVLTERVRGALSLQLAHAHAGLSGRLPVVLLDPLIEDTIRSSVQSIRGGVCLALEPEIARAVVRAVARTLSPVVQAGLRPVVLTTAEVRRFVRKLLETDLPDVAVLSFEELPPELTIQPMGRAVIRDESSALAA
jgi:type III secretion protein V